MLINPKTVLSPRASLKNLEVIWDGGAWKDGDPWSGWSAAKMIWEDHPRVGIRWNGDPGTPGVGNPQSRGLATWTIVPRPLAGAVVDAIEQHRRGNSNAEPLPPRQRLLDLISFVRAASDEELEQMLNQMLLKQSNTQPVRPVRFSLENPALTRAERSTSQQRGEDR
jgi:hypothetical protein